MFQLIEWKFYFEILESEIFSSIISIFWQIFPQHSKNPKPGFSSKHKIM